MTHALKRPEAQTSLRNRNRPKKPIGMYDYDNGHSLLDNNSIHAAYITYRSSNWKWLLQDGQYYYMAHSIHIYTSSIIVRETTAQIISCPSTHY